MPVFHQSVPSLLQVAVVCGCGGPDIELGEVSGVVTLGGKPLPNAVVTFAPTAGGPSGIGKTNLLGEYRLMTGAKRGAVVGQHKVSIICVPEPLPAPAVSSDDPSYQYGGAESSADYRPTFVPQVPARYNTQTELTEEVKPGASTINFDLK